MTQRSVGRMCTSWTCSPASRVPSSQPFSRKPSCPGSVSTTIFGRNQRGSSCASSPMNVCRWSSVPLALHGFDRVSKEIVHQADLTSFHESVPLISQSPSSRRVSQSNGLRTLLILLWVSIPELAFGLRRSGQDSSVWRPHPAAWLRPPIRALTRGCTTCRL